MRKRIFASVLALAMLLELLPGAALAAEDGADDAPVCTCTALCTEEVQNSDCEVCAGGYANCQYTEDDTSPADPNGDPEKDTDPDDVPGVNGEEAINPDEQANEPSIEEQLAELIAALPDPADIDPLDEEQFEVVYNQIAAIYAFAEENDLGDSENGLNDVTLNEAVNAVIAALYSVSLANNIEGLSGVGTESDPYIIDSVDDLAKIPDGTTAYFKQTAALDLSSASTGDAKSYISGTFSGVYDGNNQAITDAKFPLFNYVKGTEGGNARVKNINLTANVGASDSAYKSDNLSIGTSASASGAGLVTNYAHLAEFDSCTISGSFYASGNTGVGSLVGHSGTITVKNCSSSANITSSSYGVGGLVGFCQNANWSTAFGTIAGCTISGSSYSGTMTVSDTERGQDPIYGGVVGVVSGATTNSNAQVTNCNFNGTINLTSANSNAAIGGIVGMSFPKNASFTSCTVGSNASFSLPESIPDCGVFVGGVVGCLVRHATISGATITATLPTNNYTVKEVSSKTTTTGIVTGDWIGYFNSGSTTDRDDGMLVLTGDIIGNTGALTGGVVPNGVTLESSNLLPVTGAGNTLRLVVEGGGKIGTITTQAGIASLTNAGTVDSITAAYIGNDNSTNRSGVKNSGTIGNLNASSIIVVLENTGTITSVKSTNGLVRLCTNQENGIINSVETAAMIHVGADGVANKNTLSSLKAATITFYETNTGVLGTIEATGAVSGLTTQKPTSINAGSNRLVVVSGETSNYQVIYSTTATITAGSDGNYTIKDGTSDESGTPVSADKTLIFANSCTLTIDSGLSSAVSIGDIQAVGNLTILDNTSSGSNHATIKSITTNGSITMNDYYGTVSGDIQAGGNVSIAGSTGLSGTIGTSSSNNTVTTTSGNITIKMGISGTLNSDVTNAGTGDVSVTSAGTSGNCITSNITAENGTVYLKGYNAAITSALFSGDIYAEKGLTVTYNLAPISENSAIDLYLGNGATIQLVETGNASNNAGAYLRVQSKDSETPVQSLTISKGNNSSNVLNAVTIDLSGVSETLTTVTNSVTDTNLTVKAKINFDANGGTGGKAETCTIPYSLSSVGGIARENYTLAGWNTKSDGTGKAFSASDSVSLSNWAYTLYAQWVKAIGTDYTVNGILDQTYTGKEIKPAVVVKRGDNVLSGGYTVSYSNNTNVGTGKVTVTIGKDSAEVEFKIVKDENPTVKMAPVNVTYGKGYTMTATAQTSAGNEITDGTITIKYYTDESCIGDGDTTAPTNAGTYYAKATLTGTDNYAEASKTAKITISNATFSVTATGYDKSYDGLAHSITVTADDDVTVTYSETENGTYSSTNPEYTNVGTYTVYYKAEKANHDDVTGEMSVKISPATLTATYAGETIQYGETPALEVLVTGFVNDETAKTAEGYKAPTVSAANMTVGEYTLTPAGGEAKNYTFNYGKGVLVISSASYPVTISANRPSLTGGGTVTLTVKAADGIRVSGLSCDVTGIAITTNNDGTYSAQLPNKTQDYKFTVEIDGDMSNYEGGPASCIVSVTRQSSGGSSSTPTYTVTTPTKVDNGSVTVSPKNASKGDTVTITVKPDEGYELDELVVTDKDGDALKLTEKSGNKFTFKMPASKVTVSASFVKIDEEPVKPVEPVELPFTDVAESAWYADAVRYVYEKGLMGGSGSTETFQPEAPTTRAMLVTILYRLEGEPAVSGASDYTDVPAGQYYTDAVAWATRSLIVQGYDGLFRPDDTLTRQDLATILYRYASYKGYDMSARADLADYPDAGQIGVYAVDAMAWANAGELITGMPGNLLAPQSDSTRAVMATILMRFCESVVK